MTLRGVELDRRVRYLVNEQNRVSYVEVDGKQVWFYAFGWASWWIARFPNVNRIDDIPRCPPPMTSVERESYRRLNQELNSID